MSTPTTNAPGVPSSKAASEPYVASATPVTATETTTQVLYDDAPRDTAAGNAEEESFKQLFQDFVLGRNQNPDDMPGLRFYIVFAGMLALALVGVAAVATFIGLIRWVSVFFR
ncbi:MAG: hypothetical protein NZ585_06565 [Chloracidobacterium sp.]|nr:hypothetical protein [Chloracidobacterium sp.]MDW8218349.1 hypothetical protein [Acidobacteriota bacterium]